MDFNSASGYADPEKRSMSPRRSSVQIGRSRSSSPRRMSSEQIGRAGSPTAATSMMAQDRAMTPPPYAPLEYAATGYDHGEEPSWRDKHSSLPKFAIPVALAVGLAIAGGASFGVVKWVQNLQDNATIDGNMIKWKAEAKDKVYNACYFGCHDDRSCTDPWFAYNACEKTAQATVKGVNCDANAMWNWREQDKYPEKCLEAVGRLLQGQALEDLRNSQKSKLGLLALTIIGGIAAGVAVFFLWRRFTTSKKAREAAKVGRPYRARTWRPNTWRSKSEKKSSDEEVNSRPFPFSDEPGTQRRSRSSSPKSRSRSRSRSRSNSPSLRGGGGNGRRGFHLLTGFLAVFGHSSTARAYACTREVSYDQYFSLSTGGARGAVLGGVIHGWLSDCKDREDCKQSCHTSCKTVDGKRKCTEKCSKKCHTKTTTEKWPRDFVEYVAPKVRACGFKLVDGLSGGRGNMEAKYRVPNPKIERDLWVQIKVTGFNVTNPDKTDDAVWCLYGIAGSGK